MAESRAKNCAHIVIHDPCAFACGINAIPSAIGSSFDNKELAPVFSARSKAYGGAVLE
jgi:hypothetical protein